MAMDYRLRHDEFESLTPVPESSQPLRGRNSSVSIGSMDVLSPVATQDDNELKVKKLKSKLKNIHKLGLPPDEMNQMRLELYSELDDLEGDDSSSTTNGSQLERFLNL